ncbi:12503_t:CDS:2 [Gigaspora margarita]|uniref:12503_t:CDS:1 n=1 Tax=Gigaspora margarita TaxID=4874 RepID=A0ABN7UVF9_GIGMA|nr:12503_t:CDS:2 [Gigaspora margarita]
MDELTIGIILKAHLAHTLQINKTITREEQIQDKIESKEPNY